MVYIKSSWQIARITWDPGATEARCLLNERQEGVQAAGPRFGEGRGTIGQRTRLGGLHTTRLVVSASSQDASTASFEEYIAITAESHPNFRGEDDGER